KDWPTGAVRHEATRAFEHDAVLGSQKISELAAHRTPGRTDVEDACHDESWRMRSRVVHVGLKCTGEGGAEAPRSSDGSRYVSHVDLLALVARFIKLKVLAENRLGSSHVPRLREKCPSLRPHLRQLGSPFDEIVPWHDPKDDQGQGASDERPRGPPELVKRAKNEEPGEK